MRTALVLLFVLAIAAIPGTILPQRSLNQGNVADYIANNGRLAEIYDQLQLFDVFESTWFNSIFILLTISLVGCILPRSWDHYKAMKTPPTRAPKSLARLPLHATGMIDKPISEVTAHAYRRLKRWKVAEYGAVANFRRRAVTTQFSSSDARCGSAFSGSLEHPADDHRVRVRVPVGKHRALAFP
ncbi:ResB-like family [Corynebacterium camporealensis]|uniref:ResB-like family n=1 Tax=Corynebacterium camporealensis TaxID=161896 RepID=A0A0F6QU72_9CORY|nr:ResB-like family [Corynebacterium camporealensis]AVH87386.1 ResB-like family [Corynebacterium camporealensis]